MWPLFLFRRTPAPPQPAGAPTRLNSIVSFLARRDEADEGFVINTQCLGLDQFEYHTFSPVHPGEILHLKIVSGPSVLDVEGTVLTVSDPSNRHLTGIIGFRDLTPQQRQIVSNIVQRFKTCIA